MNGEIVVVDSVYEEFARRVAERLSTSPSGPLRLGCSGGGSGHASFAALAARTELDFSRIELFFVDERCVEEGSPDANSVILADALGSRLVELGRFETMDCASGPEHYAAVIAGALPLGLCQLGLGPDGHTASLFPNSPALDSPPGVLVAANADPSGRNRYERMTLTYEALASCDELILTVAGADKAEVLAAIAEGADLPAARLVAPRITWLCDPLAAAKLPGMR